jgi:sigma-B regulation protein RsbU (phosphoserine phosphatase)
MRIYASAIPSNDKDWQGFGISHINRNFGVYLLIQVTKSHIGVDMGTEVPTHSLTASLLTPVKTYPIVVLLVDDQPIIAEALKSMLKDEEDILLHYCSNPAEALSKAEEVQATVILQDLVMPEFDGLVLVKYFKANSSTKNIPIIVLSVKEDPSIKAEAFALGANDYIVKFPDRLELIARIRYHSRAYIRLLERNEAYERLQESQTVLTGELADAADYVKSLLPEPLDNSLKSGWRFIPSTQLGGDAFGYHWLDDRHFVIYLLDVCGHGVGAALHSISVMNVLRSENLPETNFQDPSEVLRGLNQTFQMESHHNMFFTIWYGVFDRMASELIYATGGHPPAVLIKKDEVKLLKTPGIVIGALEDPEYENAKVLINPTDRLYVFSDGVYEINRPNSTMYSLQEFIDLLVNAPKENQDSELQFIVESLQTIQEKKMFEDDFSILELIFAPE